MTKKIRVVLNNEAWVDYPVPDTWSGSDWNNLIANTMRSGGVIFGVHAFIPYHQIQTIFFFDGQITINTEGKGVTLQ